MTPSACGTSPKYDMEIRVDKFNFVVGFGGGRRGLKSAFGGKLI